LSNLSYVGFRARAIALPFVSARYPHPSSTVNTIGFGRLVIESQDTWSSAFVPRGAATHFLHKRHRCRCKGQGRWIDSHFGVTGPCDGVAADVCEDGRSCDRSTAIHSPSPFFVALGL